MRKIAWVVSYIFLSFAAEAGHQAIYGEDNRQEVVHFPELADLAQSVPMLVDQRKLIKGGEDSFVFSGPTLQEEFNLCKGQRFEDQPVLGSCSGALIGEDLVLTAAHCTKSLSCEHSSWVFDYQLDKNEQLPNEISKKQVFECEKIVHVSSYPSLEIDFAIIKLKDKVFGRRPLKLSENVGKQIMGKEILMLGYPNGIPLKVTDQAKVSFPNPNSFKTNLDAFGGNSGAPVFDQNSMEVLGILISGKGDYEKLGECQITKVSPQLSMQETVTNASLVLDVLRSLGLNN